MKTRVQLLVGLFVAAVALLLHLPPSIGKCRGRWSIHACGGGNGKRSDTPEVGHWSSRKAKMSAALLEPDSITSKEDEEDEEDEEEEEVRGGGGGGSKTTKGGMEEEEEEDIQQRILQSQAEDSIIDRLRSLRSSRDHEGQSTDRQKRRRKRRRNQVATLRDIWHHVLS